MSKRILVIGAGFAGMWSTLSAARLIDQHGRADIESHAGSAGACVRAFMKRMRAA